MNIQTSLAALATVAGIALASSASAATLNPTVTADCAGNGPTALSMGSFTCGSAARSNLGSIEFDDNVGSMTGNTSFFSLGLNGTLVAEFAKAFTGPTAIIVEVTNAPVGNHKEAVEIFGSVDGTAGTFVSLGTLTNLVAPGSTVNPGTLTFNGTYRFLGFRDVSQSVFASTTSTDGYDISRIAVAPVPLPAAGLMLLGGLAGLGALRARRKAA